MNNKEKEAMIRLFHAYEYDFKQLMNITGDNTTVNQSNQLATLMTNVEEEIRNYEGDN